MLRSLVGSEMCIRDRGSPTAVAECHSYSRSAPTEAPPVQQPVKPPTTLPGRSSRDAVPELRRASTSTMKIGSNLIQLHADAGLSNYRTVSGPHRSVTGNFTSNDQNVVRTSTSSATANSHITSVSHSSTAGDTLTQSLTANFGGRASASPQLRRWNPRPESGSQSSAAAQAGGTDHHHHYLKEPSHKPHSVPCSPRLQARLAATQPWRPWSPSTSGGVLGRPFQTADSGSSGQSAMHDFSQLASSLLLAKIIRDRQEEERSCDLRLHGKYARCIEM